MMRSIVLVALTVAPALAQPSTPQPSWPVKQGDALLRDFKFAGGGSLPESKIHYRTLGSPRRDAHGHVTNAVMLLHGTSGSGAQFLNPVFSNQLFPPEQPLDIARFYV
ncbi:MAG: hypothetical protein WAJ87_09230, partial [Bryobacteraceae bacterium]